NPFGPAAAGWSAASEAMDFASSRFRDGYLSGFDRIAWYDATDLAVIHEADHWQTKVAGRQELSDFDLRVTTTFRLEDRAWKIVHRHADPTATFNTEGPLHQ